MEKILTYSWILLLFIGQYSWSQTTQWTALTDGDGARHSAMVTDDLGNTYTTGRFFDSVDVDPGPGRFMLYNYNNLFSDVYIKKLDSQGNLVWAKSIGGYGYDESYSIALDAAGNVYVTGDFTEEVDFDPGPGVVLLSDNTSWDQDAIFLLKLDNAGNFVWADVFGMTSLAGATGPEGRDLAIDAAGYIYLTGTFHGTLDFDPGPAVQTASSNGGAFIEKLDSNGNFIWVKTIDHIDDINITCDDLGTIYLTGDVTQTTDINPGAGVYTVNKQGISALSGDIFFMRLTNNGDFVWANSISNSLDLDITDVMLGHRGHLYLTGTFQGIIDFDPSAGVEELTSDSITNDVFILKMDTANNFEWARRFGNRQEDRGAGITQDYSGNVYIVSRLDKKGRVCKVDSAGYTVWNKLIDLPSAPAEFDPVSISYVHNKTLYIAGLDDYFFQNVNSFVTKWDLTGEPSIGFLYASACKSYGLNGQVYTNSGTYTQVIPNVEGGDSTLTLFLTITAPELNTIQIGNQSSDAGTDIITDQAGNQYITGSFTGTVDFDPSSAVFNLSAGSGTDGFIQKLSPQGQLIWVKAIAGSGILSGRKVALDAAGNVYVLGGFNNSINTGTGVVNAAGNSDIFLQKLDPTGTIVWTKIFQGTGNDVGGDLVLDNTGHLYLTGFFQNTVDFDPNAGTTNLTATGGSDWFIQKMDLAGNLVWVKSIGAGSRASGNAISLDHLGNLIIVGNFENTVDFDPNAGTFNLTAQGQDMGILKLDNAGNFVWAKGFGSVYYTEGYDIATDNAGNVYCTGMFTDMVDFDPGPASFNVFSFGNESIYVLKLDNNGNFVWVKAMNGASTTFSAGHDLVLGASGDIYLAGYFSYGTVDFDPSSTNFPINSIGRDVFVQHLTNNGDFVWAKSLTGTGHAVASGIALNNNTLHIVGYFEDSTDFDPGTNVYALESNGGRDIFIQRLDTTGEFPSNGSTDTLVVSTCSAYTLNGQTYTQTGIYTQNLINAAGCDSILVLDLTNTSSQGVDVQIACGAYTWIDGNTYTSSTNSPTFTFAGAGAGGCDSIVTLNLTINSATGVDVQVACGAYTWLDGNTYTSSTNSPTFTLTGAAVGGCDSIVTLNLTISSGVTGTDVQTACGSFTWIDGNTYTSSTNSPTHTLAGAAAGGCDSIVTLNLTIAGAGTYTVNSLPYTNFTTTSWNTVTLGDDDLSGFLPIGFSFDFFGNTYNNFKISSNGYLTFDILATTSGCCSGEFLPTASPRDDIIALFWEDLSPNLGGSIRYLTVGTAPNRKLVVEFLNVPHYGNNNPVTGQVHLYEGTNVVEVYIGSQPKATGTHTLGIEDATGTIGYSPAGRNATTWTATTEAWQFAPDANGVTSTASHTACGSFTWIDGNTYTSSTNSPTYTYVGGATGGCDSTITLDLTILPPATGIDVQTVCGAYTWIDGNTYSSSTNSPTYTLVGAAAGGCDSIVTLNLTINSATGVDVQTACGAYTWIDGNTYTSSTNSPTYTLVGAAVGGCDSVVTLNLTITGGGGYTVSSITHSTLGASSWNTVTLGDDAVSANLPIGFNFDFFGNTYSTFRISSNGFISFDVNMTSSGCCSGEVLPNASSFDNVVALFWEDLAPNLGGTVRYLTVGTAPNRKLVVEFLNVPHYGNSNPVTGQIHLYEGTNIVETHVVSQPKPTGTHTLGIENATGTVGYSPIGRNGTTWTASFESWRFAPSAGIATTDVQTACGSYTWIDGNTYTSSNNTATVTLTSAAGCDSVVTLDLTINTPSSGVDVQTACGSYTWLDGNTYTSSNNTATVTLTNAAGCDSVVTLDLTINTPSSGVDVQTACGSYTWLDGNTYTSSNNTATVTLTNAVGCDSIVTLDLTINALSSGVDVQTACGSYTWLDGNTYTSSNNTATITLTNAVGCDSIVTLNLTINTVDVTTTVNGNVITANATGATYQWLDCDNGNVPVAGATNASFTPPANGNYAVIITQNGCVDTSACVNVVVIATKDIEQGVDWVTVYPNPTNRHFSIALQEDTPIRVWIYAANGQLAQQKLLQGQKIHHLGLEGAAGVYFLQIQTENKVYYSKIIKE